MYNNYFSFEYMGDKEEFIKFIHFFPEIEFVI